MSDQQHWPAILPYGAEGGIAAESDALVNVTADGVALYVLWSEVQEALSVWNAERSAIGQLLSRLTINAADAVPQAMQDESFDRASEFGEPEGIRSPGTALLLGNTLEDYDKAGRFSWRFLRDSTAEQVRAVTNYALAADNKLTNGLILKRLFDPAIEHNEFNHNCYGLWTGTDGLTPPPHLGRVFESNHTHYLVSGNDSIDPGDLESAIEHVTEHGYGVEATSRLLAFMPPALADTVACFRAGIETNSVVAHHDYIPSAGAPAYLQPDNIVGEVAPKEINGLKIDGSYGPLWIVRSQYIPSGYFAVVATDGANSDNNVVSVRQHVNTAYQGLRSIPGKTPGYPIQESFWARAIGVGTRHRGAACVMQIKASGNYATPTIAI
ncbi:hypothetical protein [Mycolicibacter sinensis]|uniref:Bacteriophage protein n=2 Tax=Mycolicibacter sinensis (strain JDM601) TaxID=875328 RepID=A0A1A2EQ00_MYCSD|nr:hypothetical protein [Mycolicibacter sinensis]OBG06619.1 hypothetical protein A5772_21525 [Mycolicibacter sinensis]OBG09396.1 hypothetical protein A5771_01560 [Mycolicibacter sinensis]